VHLFGFLFFPAIFVLFFLFTQANDKLMG